MKKQRQLYHTDRIRHEQALARMDRFARLLDSQFRIPFTRIRFGLDPLIGLLPGIGDLAGFVLSLYLVAESVRLGAGGRLSVRMLGNVAVEFVIGLVPILGDAFDLMWRANDRNAAMLRQHIEQQLAPQPDQPAPKRTWVWVLLTGLVIAAAVALVTVP